MNGEREKEGRGYVVQRFCEMNRNSDWIIPSVLDCCFERDKKKRVGQKSQCQVYSFGMGMKLFNLNVICAKAI